MSITDLTLSQLLPSSVTSTPAVSIRQEDKIWVATGMLVHYLESFTDSLVVTDEKDNPIGVMGGIEIIKNIFENCNSDFFYRKTVADVVDKELIQVSSDTVLKDILKKWQETQRAFSILPNQYGGYSAISARKLLEVGAKCKTDITISDLPYKKVVTFSYSDTMGEIIHSMLENKTRKLVFKDSSSFISDRIIIQTIAQEFDYLKNTESFLEQKFKEPFKLANIKTVSEDLNLADLSRLMFGMMHPYVMTKDQVYSPWDICMALLSKDVFL